MNLKSKFDFKSIRFKLWAYFIVFALLLIGLIWFLQIFFLNNYYEQMKSGEITKLADKIIESYEEEGRNPYKLTEILEDAYAPTRIFTHRSKARTAPFRLYRTAKSIFLFTVTNTACKFRISAASWKAARFTGSPISKSLQIL